MGQVSKPMQIALVAVLLLAVAWFLVLRPKSVDGASDDAAAPVTTTAATAPGQAGLQRAVDRAERAVATSRSSAAAAEAATGEPAASAGTRASGTTGATRKGEAHTTTTKTAPAEATPAATDDPSAALLAHLAQGDVVAVLFAQDGGADDADARRALRRLAVRDRRVVTRVAPITQVGRYEAITTGVSVLTAPTIVLVGKGHRAVSVGGYTELATLQQLVGDLRRGAR